MSKRTKKNLISNQFDFESFSRDIEATLISDSHKILTTWKTNCEQHLREFCAQIDLFHKACEISDGQVDKNCNPLTRFDQFSLILKQFKTPSQTMLQPDQFRQAWEEANKQIKTIPAVSRETIRPEIQKILKSDNLKQISEKIIAQTWLFHRKQKNKFENSVRKIRKKDLSPEIWNWRNVIVERFVRVYILLPIQKEILTSWNSYNRQLSNQFHTLQKYFVEATRFEFSTDPGSESKLSIAEYQMELQNKIDDWFEKTKAKITFFIQNQISLASQNWLIAATPQFSERKYNQKKLLQSVRNYGQLFIRYRKAWQTQWNGEIKDWQKQIDLSRICWTAFLSRQNLEKSISQTLQKKISQRLQFMTSEFSEHKKKIQTVTYKNKTQLLSSIKRNRTEISKALLNNFIPDTIDALLDIELGKNLENYRQILKTELASLEDEYIIFKIQDSDKLIPESVLESIPLKELLSSRINSIYVQLDELQTQINDTLLNISNDLSSLIDTIEYMAETAQEICENSRKDDFDEINQKVVITLTDGYQRAIDVTLRINSNLLEMQNIIYQTTNTFVTRFNEITSELRENEKLLKLKFELVGSRTKRKLSGLKHRVLDNLIIGSRVVFRLFMKRMNKASDSINVSYRRLSEITRLRSVDQENSRAISEYLKKTRDNLSQLPSVYSRLFRFQPLENNKLFVKRIKEQEKLEEIYSNWKKGNTGLVAVVGERGSGRTSFINQNLNILFDNTQVRNIKSDVDIHSVEELFEFLKVSFSQPQATNLEELEQIVSEDESRSICILENLHKLFIKTIEGLEIIKRLVLFMMRTDRSVFWLITCSYYTWNFLDKVVGISTLFGSTIDLEDLSSTELAELILKRHKLSGLPHKYVPSEALRNTPRYRKLTNQQDEQEWLKNRFFTTLEEVSDGNISVAMLYWLNCIKILDNKKIIVTTGDQIDLRFLQNLSTDDLFAIVVLIQHETINITEFSRVLNLAIDEARLILTSLNNRGIVIEKNGKFELHFFLYRPMTRILYEKRLLH